MGVCLAQGDHAKRQKVAVWKRSRNRQFHVFIIRGQAFFLAASRPTLRQDMREASRHPKIGPSTTGMAVLGGSFNPPHRTHITLAREALARLPINQLRAIPSGDHPHKRGGDMAPAPNRLEMTRLAFSQMPGVHVDDRELHRSGPSYTVDTLAELAEEAPGAQIFFLIGSDNLPLLPSWHQHHRLLQLATVVTFPRKGYPITADSLLGLDLTPTERESLLTNMLDLPADEVSASDLRARWRNGERSLAELPATVTDSLLQHDLYR